MIERKGGSIIIVSSIGGLRGSNVLGAYCISKAADLQLARNLAVEYGPHNVRVNCIAPGLIRTDFARALWDNPERWPRAAPKPRCAASANPTRSPAPRCTWLRRPARS
jgi:NAD(P)-dependent dehydrogenase (short-subunit alcohol dehydrogenase family)